MSKLTEAQSIARCYQWDALDADGLPSGREVGQTIALLLQRPAIVLDRHKQQEEEEMNRWHARRLARLRVLL